MADEMEWLNKLLDKFAFKEDPSCPETGPITTPESQAEAEQAIRSAEAHLESAIQDRERVGLVAESLRDHRERNHFAEMIAASMGEKRNNA